LLPPFARYCCPCVAMIHKLSKGRLNSPAQTIKIDKSFRAIDYLLILGERRGTAINIRRSVSSACSSFWFVVQSPVVASMYRASSERCKHRKL
jgi:hypothetical protein